MKIKNIEEEKAYLGIDFCDRGSIWTIWTDLLVPIYSWSYTATKNEEVSKFKPQKKRPEMHG
jgi:hypothetical protein